MKTTTKIWITFSLCLLFLGGLFTGPAAAQAAEQPLQERLLSLELEDADFAQALEAIAEQLKIDIDYQAIGQKPSGTRDLSFSEVPLGQALKKTLNSYGIIEHVTNYNEEEENIRLLVLKSAAATAALPPEKAHPKGGIWDNEPLTEEQLERSRKKSALIETEMEKSLSSLTPDQLKKQQEKSSLIEAEMEKSLSTLTPDQLKKQQEKSALIEAEMEKSLTSLTPDQLKKQLEKSALIERQ